MGMGWVPHPDNVIRLRATGIGDMGNITDKTKPPRFSLPRKFVFVYMKMRFINGNGISPVLY